MISHNIFNIPCLSVVYLIYFQGTGGRRTENRHGTFTAKAIYYSSRGVICQLPENQRSMFAKSQEAFHIRVSNNGYLWSNPVLRIGYDSLCMSCTDAESCATKVRFD